MKMFSIKLFKQNIFTVFVLINIQFALINSHKKTINLMESNFNALLCAFCYCNLINEFIHLNYSFSLRLLVIKNI